ncbi:uncharacterized protein LOC134276069 [Saccostrea cucullata]|uniref:uncharacterized protein LOC134276069 n=1 Tax=Saccostrea cuccullata TaxID=36930 RepID=UPI002ED28C6C
MAGRIGGHSLARRLSRESKEHDLSCSGPSPMIEGFLLAISALECGRRFTNIGPFNCRARVILISNGKTISSTDLDSEYRVTENEDQSLLRSIAYGSRGGKILHYEEATQFAKYSLNMMIAGDILGEVPPTFCTIDDVKSLVFSTRFQHVVTERDLEDVVEILNNRRVYEINVYPNEEQLELHEYTERDERLPPPGTRVRRGPCWPYNDQNSDGGVNVEWDNTLKFPYQYDPDDQRLCSVIVCDEPRILQREEIAVGCVVKRGPDWKWGNQDGGASNIGAVYRVKEDVVYVRWPNGNKSNYRFGYDGKFDIVVW